MGVAPAYPSTSWAIGGGAGIGVSYGIGVSGIGLTLVDVNAQIKIPLFISTGFVGGGLKAGVTISTFSPTFFKTPPITTHDFDGRVSLFSAGLTILVGGSLTYVTFWGVDHDPYWLDIGGVNSGISAGIELHALGIASTYPEMGEFVVGDPIVPW
jgi:hypothetical protein